MSRPLAVALLVLLADPAVCAADPPIVGGTVAPDDRAVYLLWNGPSSCTAALVSPHVVLTARHCLVDATTDALLDTAPMRVYVGTGPTFDTDYRVSDVLVVPGSTARDIDAGAPDDLGLVILDRAAMETPYVMDRGSPSDLIGQPFVSIGFGRIPDGSRGVKYRVTTRVDSAGGGMFWTPPSICAGDSGGPGIGPNGHIYGVAVLGPLTMCGTGTGGYNAIDLHRAWIDSVLEAVGDVCIPDPEICDGSDNDCNGVIDDDCLPDGAACSEGTECASLVCGDTAVGRVCARPCDPTEGSAACDAGTRCVRSTDCEGFCVPDTAAMPDGAACMSDLECRSGGCLDPGDGRRRCLTLCRGDGGGCLSGEACTGGPGLCGACVPQSVLVAPRGLGEECLDDDDCRSGQCASRAGVSECVASCEGTPCAVGFVCQSERCVLERHQPIGGSCVATSDCASSDCATDGARTWCTDDCSATPCPSGFGCVAVGDAQVCVPSLALEGESCSATADCARGECIAGVCSTSCERASDCGPGLRCVRSEGSEARCRPPNASGGCSVSRQASSQVFLVALAILLAVWRRSNTGTSKQAQKNTPLPM